MPKPRLDLPLVHAGKVREMYATDHDRLLMVATDNVSAYDRVLPTPIPGKGAVLTQLSVWWLGELTDIVPNHLVGDRVPDDVAGRAVVVERLEMVPVECVVRGYLAGSAWREYQESGTVAGIELPAGLQQGERLERPIFTPARKAEQGEHDENITYDQLVETVGEKAARELRVTSMRLYVRAERIARERGLVLVDTKFEFGRRADGTLVLADEVLTPDSSRYWIVSDYRPGQPMQAHDKQLLRDYLTHDSGWDPDSGEVPELPDDMVQRLQETYAATFRRLTGHDVTRAADLPPVREDAQAQGQQETGVAEPVVRADAAEAGAGSPAAPSLADSDAAGATAQGLTPTQAAGIDDTSDGPSVTFIVEVMPKPEILDPQGKTVTGALRRLGFEGLSVRQGKLFEIVAEGELTQERVDQVRDAAERLLANTVIEDFEVSVLDFDDEAGSYEDADHDAYEGDDHDHDGHDHDGDSR